MPPATTNDNDSALRNAAAALLLEARRTGNAHTLLQRVDRVPVHVDAAWRLASMLLTIRTPEVELPPAVAADIDVAWAQRAAAQGPPTSPSALPAVTELFGVDTAAGKDERLMPLRKMAVWCGDITTLAADAIVNAANSALLGCFQPDHVCIDNVIHAAAGPALRRDCATIMAAQGSDEPVGAAKVTRGYHLPSRFVIHTVGPQVPRHSSGPTATQREQLRQCYQSCLDAAQAVGSIRSVAFCCISTGLFGFPQDVAASIAVSEVFKWLAAHPEATVQRVVFNVFRADDAQLYQDALEALVCSITGVTLQAPLSVAEREIGRAVEWILDADCILVAGGAGLSAAAGLDYTDTQLFARLFPSMAARGFSCMYDFIGFDDWESEALRWGYLSTQLDLARFRWPLHPVYGCLLDMVRGRDYFALTSNVDGMLERNGFDPTRIYTPQGDYARMQCLTPCSDDVWPIRPYIDAALAKIDSATLIISEATAVPACPHCGGRVIMNVRGGDWFIDAPDAGQKRAFESWVRNCVEQNRKLVVIEVGSGFSTAAVVRGRCESIVAAIPRSRLVRINAVHGQVPATVVGRSAQVFADADSAVRVLWNAVHKSRSS